jgi:hypothetical protein
MRSRIALIAVVIALTGCGDSPSKIYGKWKQGNDVIEFAEKTMTVVGQPAAIDRYEVKDGKVSVFLKGNPLALVFAFKSSSEICAEAGLLLIDGCFKKV